MPREWEPEELIARWTLVDGDAALVGNKSGPTRLGVCLAAEIFEFEGGLLEGTRRQVLPIRPTRQRHGAPHAPGLPVLGAHGRDHRLLVDLLVGLVHKIKARAGRRVEGELIDNLKRVRAKEGILFRIAEAAVAQPEGTVVLPHGEVIV
ncbi:MAG: hypothetical protein ACRDRT_00605, partial [Pseudonocardiaceae bacterium]